MINTFDNSAVESYIKEQIRIQSEATRKVQLANDRQEVYNKAIKYGVFALALGIGIYIALSGIGNALSFEQIKRDISSVETGGAPAVESHFDAVSEDQILDVESLINEGSTEPSFPGSELPETSGEVVTNYVIFEYQQIDIGKITRLVVGRQYPESGADTFDAAWCYAELTSSGETSETFYFIDVDGDKRTTADISGDALYRLGITEEQAIQVRGLCGI